ncbi:MAG: methyltransferase domain-containing protein [Candidatus Shapirobacteria bacterium]|jgi:SAM-dependent methyltransferase
MPSDPLSLTPKGTREYSYYQIHLNRFSRIISEITTLNLKPQSTVLDIGCYPPILYRSLKTRFRIQGVTFFHPPSSDPNIVSLNVDTTTLPYPDNTFDLVLLSEVLEHLTNPGLAISEIARVLKPSGKLLVTTPNVNRSQNIINLIFSNNIYFSLAQLFETKISDGTIYHRHNREYTFSELVSIFSAPPLSVSKIFYSISFSPFRSKNRQDPLSLKLIKTFNYLLMKLFPRYQDTLFLIASKLSKPA